MVWRHQNVIKLSLRMASLMTWQWCHCVKMTSLMTSSVQIKVTAETSKRSIFFRVEEVKLLRDSRFLAGGRTLCPGCWLSVLHFGSFHEDQRRNGEFNLILEGNWFSFVVRRWCMCWIRSSLKLALICVSFKIHINYGCNRNFFDVGLWWKLSSFMSLLGFCPFLVHNESLHNFCCILKSLCRENVRNRPRSYQIWKMTKTPIKFFCGENQKIFHRGSKSMKILLRIISRTYIPNLQRTIQPYHRQ